MWENEIHCPFFEGEEIKRGKTTVICAGGDVRFPTENARRSFIYPLCASEKGYKECSLFKMLEGDQGNSKECKKQRSTKKI